MEKPLACANDLADHDVIEDDNDLVFGPLPSKLCSCGVAAVPPGKQLKSSSSFKDASILGSAALVSKLSQSIPVQTQPLLALRISQPDSHVYAGGNPVICTASASRPSSACARKPRSSAPSGEAAQVTDSAPVSKSYSGGKTAVGSDTSAALQDGVEPRTKGDIQGNDRDSSTAERPKSGLLRRLSSLTLGSRPPAAMPDAASDGPGAAAALRGTKSSLVQGSRGPMVSCSVPRCAAIPCVDVDPERRQLRQKLSLQDSPPARPSNGAVGGTVRSQPPPLPGDAAAEAAARAAATGPNARTANANAVADSSMSMEPAAAAAAVTASHAPERPLTPLRRLSRLLPSSLVPPAAVAAAADQQRDQDGGTAAQQRRPSSASIRDLFSRPSSAKRKSEAGTLALQQPPPPMEAWKHPPPLPQQQEQQQQWQQWRQHTQNGCNDDDGPEKDTLLGLGAEGGGGLAQQPSGILKRAANALAAALAR